MSDEEKFDPDDEVSKDEAEFDDESLLSFVEVEGEGETEEAALETEEVEPSSLRDSPGGLKVDDVLAGRHTLEIDTSDIRTEIPITSEIEPKTPEEPPKELTEESATETATPMAEIEEPEQPASPDISRPEQRQLEIHSPKVGDEVWKIEKVDRDELDARVKAAKPEPVKFTPEAKVRVDHERLTKLDEELKDELELIREKSQEGVIPGEFLEARRRLADEGILECPRCKIRVPDVPGKVDYCPECGLALDDYFGEFKVEWERKYKRKTSEGVKEFGLQKPRRERTRWEMWKEEKGVDPEAELLVCPVCGIGVYDDPFVAKKCPECHIPLDLHLQFPRDYIRKRETTTKGRRYGALKEELGKEKKKRK